MVSPPVITVSRTARRRGPLLPLLIPALLVVLITVLIGLWWVTPLVGLVLGLLLGGFRSAGIAFLSGLVGWGLGLLWQEIHIPIGGTANAVAGIMGFGASGGVIVIALTLLIGALLATAGAWVGVAIHGLFASRTRSAI